MDSITTTKIIATVCLLNGFLMPMAFGLFWGALILGALFIWLLLLSDIGIRKNRYSSRRQPGVWNQIKRIGRILRCFFGFHRSDEKGCRYCNKGRRKQKQCLKN